jgi:hypothetical protein
MGRVASKSSKGNIPKRLPPPVVRKGSEGVKKPKQLIRRLTD